MEKFNLTGKCALITGGSRGIGFGIASALAEAGADIVLVSRQPKGLTEARDRLASKSRKISTYPFDMNDADQIEGFYETIIKDTGGIDILVNNAGGTRRGPAESISADDWHFVINLYLTSVFKMSQAFA